MKVLLTGATGYIGRRLKEKLLADRNVKLRLFVRNIRKVRESSMEKVEIVEGDSFNMDALRKAARGMDVAYYLIHSMGAKGDFRELDRISAENFREACIAEGVKRIIYLGGLGKKETASKHLLSRIETGEILCARPDKIQVIWFRASIIIGSGSASFEILWNFVEKIPFMVVPQSIRTLTQPISVDDVLEYLDRARKIREKKSLIVDIGSEIMTFQDMLMKTASIIGVKRYFFHVPILTPGLTSYILTLLFPVPYRITSALLKGLNSETIALNDNAEKYFAAVKPVSFEKAMKKAIDDIENNQVLSRWSDSSAAESCDIIRHENIAREVLVDRRVTPAGSVRPADMFRAVMSIGGENGWFTYHFLWEIRGFLDKIIGGYGISRGRRDHRSLRIGDSLDFWKVVDIEKNRRVLLCAQMKLPGKAWLEFVIEGNRFIQTAYFLPHGLWGYLYWYLLKPTHFLIFRDMAKNIVKQAEKTQVKKTG
jgi:uncharacterized protein YbjT (DUF2867 family)